MCLFRMVFYLFGLVWFVAEQSSVCKFLCGIFFLISKEKVKKEEEENKCEKLNNILKKCEQFVDIML